VRRSTIPLLLLATLTFFAGLGRGAITDSDESFYAESAREMVESGDWLTPHYNYEDRFQKPAFYYWVTATLYTLTGSTEAAARLGSAAAGVGLVLVVAACARRWFDEETALLAGAITATNFGYFSMARMALPDLPLTFFITVTIWAALVATLERENYPRHWLLLSAGAAALGFLTKGPVAIVIPALVLIPVLLIERRSFDVDAFDLVLAALLFLAIALPWYLAMWLHHGTDYLRSFFVGDNFERFATSRFNDPRPWWFYLPVLAGGLLPWTALTLVWLRPLLQFLLRRRAIASIDLRLVMWAALPLLFYTLSVGKQPRYILPALPPIAILLASSVLERTREWRSRDGMRVPSRPNVAVVLGCLAAGLFMLTVAVLLYRARHLFIDVSDEFTIAAAIVIGVASVVPVVISLTPRWRAGPGLVAVAAAVMFAALPFGVMAAPRDSAVQQMARYVRTHHRPGQEIATYGVFVRSLIFYTGVRQTDLINDDHAVEWLAKNPRALVVLPAAALERLERDRGMAFQRLAELPYFDDGAIKVRTILWPDPEQDLYRVWLVVAP
jgi:4-amino-4-deoxy-L-arabinose transferase-like glycosyltransferase